MIFFSEAVPATQLATYVRAMNIATALDDVRGVFLDYELNAQKGEEFTVEQARQQLSGERVSLDHPCRRDQAVVWVRSDSKHYVDVNDFAEMLIEVAKVREPHGNFMYGLVHGSPMRVTCDSHVVDVVDTWAIARRLVDTLIRGVVQDPHDG